MSATDSIAHKLSTTSMAPSCVGSASTCSTRTAGSCSPSHPHRPIVVDPGDDPSPLLAACTDVDVTLIVLTHTHGYFDAGTATQELLAA